jgi:hypothetical protein
MKRLKIPSRVHVLVQKPRDTLGRFCFKDFKKQPGSKLDASVSKNITIQTDSLANIEKYLSMWK